MNVFLLYLILMADNFQACSALIFFLGCFSVMVAFVLGRMCEDAPDELVQRCESHLKSKLLRIAIIIGVLGITFMPGTKELTAMVVIPKILENEFIQDLPDQLCGITQRNIDKWMGFDEEVEE